MRRFREREQAGTHEAYGRNRGRARRLHHGRSESADHRARAGAPGEPAQHASQGAARQGAQAVGEDDHPEQKEAQTTEAQKNPTDQVGIAKIGHHGRSLLYP
jgi:hypothetical protein